MTATPPPYGPPEGQPPNGYPYGQPGVPPYLMAPEHPQANTALVLGILSLVICGLIGPFAWSMGTRVVREIDASAGRLGGRSAANAGRITGMIATILLGVSVLFGVGILALAALQIAST